MARIIDNQTNIWGRQLGPDIQRSDLWIVDFNQALGELAQVVFDASPMTPGLTTPFLPAKLATYFAYSVNIPALRIKGECVNRDSRPYMVPSWDEAPEPVRMSFLLDCFKPGGRSGTPYRSDIYQMLDVWRAVVRAGRGSMSSEFAITLDGNYRIDYAHDVRVLLMRPSSSPSVNIPRAGAIPTADQSLSISNDLEFSLQLRLVNCWLASFNMSELSYEGARFVQLDCLFYTEDVRQEPQQNQ